MNPTSFIISLMPCLALPYVCVTEQLKVNEISKILNEHNRLRKNVANGKHGFHVANMQKLTWSTSLQDIATNLAHCGRQRNISSQFHLEVNIGQVTGKKFRRIIRRWFREILFVIPEFQTCVNLEDCKHFQTMTSPDHQYIGCGYNKCSNNGITLACVYEGGNNLDFPAYKSGLPCTKCKESSAFCDDGLCVKCNPLEENCDCRKTCQKPHIGNGTLDELTCTCSCSYGLGLNCDEECKNPEQYMDYDICSEITKEQCNSPFPEDNNILKEFCPEQCVCQKFPETTDIFQDV